MLTQPCSVQSRKMDGFEGSNGLGRTSAPFERIFFSGEIIPSLRAAAANMSFMIEPGAYTPLIARSSIGVRGLERAACTAAVFPSLKARLSYSGKLVIAII